MSPILRFEEAIHQICQRHPERSLRARKLAHVCEAIESYRSRLNVAYEASRNTWERTRLREAKNRLQMMLDRIRIQCSEGPETA